jgi:Secretion system C-terminal sorting domain
MNKQTALVICLMLSLFMVVFANSTDTQRPTTEPTDGLYDYQFEYPVNPGNLETSIGCDGNYIYTGSPIYAEDFLFHKYDLSGNFIENFSIPGLMPAGTDLTYDGQFFYYGSFTGVIYQLDMGTQTIVDSIIGPNPFPIQSVAYDAFFDGFWINNGGPDIRCIDRNGFEMTSFQCYDYGGFTGFAWENILPGGPHLWGYSSDGSGNMLVQFEAFTGNVVETYDIASAGISTTPDDFPGGLFITEGIVPDTWTIGGLIENVKIWGLELSAMFSPDAPGLPTDVTVTPDAGGTVEALIEWVCPSFSISGEPLGFLNEMRVYRDDLLIYTDYSPIVGQAGSYTDSGLPTFPDYYTYKVAAVNNFGEGFNVEIMQWIGEDSPSCVTDLFVEQTSPNQLSATLTWVNPTTGMNGGVFNEPILGYQIERNDGVVLDLAGYSEIYIDDSIPDTGTYSYSIRAYNSVGIGSEATSNNVFISNQDILIYEDFSSYECPPVGWSVIGEGQQNWVLSTTNNSNGQAPEGMFYLFPDFIGLSTLTSPALNTTGMNELSFEFKYFLFHAFEGYSIGISTTSDGGSTWNNAWEIYPINMMGPELVQLTINTPDVGSDNFQLGIFFNGNSMLLDIWLFDDILLLGATEPLGTISGNVNLIAGNGNVEEVLVSANGEEVNPDANGDYVLVTTPGTYSVTASLNDYESMTIDDVIVTAENISSGIDFDLMYIESYDPPCNLAVDEQTGLLSWEAPGGFANIEELIYDNNIAGNGYSYLGVTMSTRMTPAEPCQLIALKYYTSIEPGVNDFMAKVYGWDGTQPETTALYTETVTAVDDDWMEVDVSGEELFFDGDFIVGFGSINDATFIGYDQNLNNGRSWDFDSSTGVWSTWPEAYLERAIVQYPDGRIVELAPVSNNRIRIPKSNLRAHCRSYENNIQVDPIENLSRELLGYEVLLDNGFMGMTNDLFWQFENLVNGQTYEAGVRGIYETGESELITIDFMYGGTSSGDVVSFSTELIGNYPNPFNPETNISFALGEVSKVKLEIYNIKGEKVKVLLNEELSAAGYTVSWNGKDENNKAVSSGVYFYRMETEKDRFQRKMILLK